MEEGYVENNPAHGIRMRAKEKVRKRVLTEDEIRILWHALHGPGFDVVTGGAIKLQLLLGARIREVTGMTRSELALNQNPPLWTLPATRSKSKKEIPRPLPSVAVEVLRELMDGHDSDFVFASPFDDERPIIPQAPARAISRAANRGLVSDDFTPHDLRRTCRTFWAKLRMDETVAKKLLGHVPPRSDVTASVYDQHTYLPEMTRALAKWERHLLSIVGKAASTSVAA
jgi:integrase